MVDANNDGGYLTVIVDDVLQHLPDFRASALSLMVDTATVVRPGGEPTFDPETGTLTPSAGSTVYVGPCRLRQPSPSEAEVIFGDEQLTRTRFMVDLPHDTAGIAVGDVLTFTASTDPDVTGRRFQVMGVPLSTLTVHKSYPVEVVE